MAERFPRSSGQADRNQKLAWASTPDGAMPFRGKKAAEIGAAYSSTGIRAMPGEFAAELFFFITAGKGAYARKVDREWRRDGSSMRKEGSGRDAAGEGWEEAGA